MKPTTSFSLGLDDDDGIEEPRRFLTLPCGTLLAYGGEDGNVTCLRNNKSFHIVQRYDDGVRALAVSPNGKRLAVGFDSGATQIYDFDDYNKKDDGNNPHPYAKAAKKNDDDDDDDDLLMSQDFSSHSSNFFAGPQFDAPIRDLQFVDKGNDEEYWLGIASESGMVLCNVTSSDTLLEDRELEHEIQQHHDHCGIRGMALRGNLLATLAMDGRLCLWNNATQALLQREATTCIPKKDVGEVHGADAYDRSCRPVFLTNNRKNNDTLLMTPGQLLPVVRKIEGGSMERLELVNTQKDQGHIDSIIIIQDVPSTDDCSISYFLTSGRDSRLVVWKREDDDDNKVSPIETIQLESPATDLYILKGAAGNTLQVYAACAKGTCAIFDLSKYFKTPPTAKETPKESTAASSETSSPYTKTTTATEKGSDKNNDDKPKKMSAMDTGDDDDSDVDFGGGDASSSSPTNKNRVRFVDDEANEDDDAGNGDQPKMDDDKPTTSTSDTTTDKNNDVDSLLENGMPVQSQEDDFADLDEDDMNPPRFYPSAANLLPKPQPAFSPSSTPLDLARRFLCWNHIGAITLLQGDGDHNTVDVSFTDSAYKRPISFTDNMHFIVGSLGDDGGIFASDLQSDQDDGEDVIDGLDDLNMSERTKEAVKRSHKKRQEVKPTGSSVFFYRFETFDNLRDKDWYLTLPDGERVLGSACGEGWAAVVTSRNFLRLFTSGGNQAQLVWLPGTPVTVTGRGRFLTVFYHEASPLQDGTQQLGYTLWDASCFQVLSKGSVSCISKKSSLTWAGFSNDCSLMAMDSDGMLSMLINCGEDHWEWSPVLDTVGLRKSADDQFWPITVYDGKLVCVPLKGGNTYPDAARRPVTGTLGLRLPLAKSSTAKNTALEELSVRSNMALSQKKFINDLEGGSEEEFEREYLTLTAQVDKVTLKLFAATVDARKLERALDLVDRLHLEKSYDLAIKLADRHHKLADLIEEAKERKFAEDEEEEFDEVDSPGTTFMDRLAPSLQISPDTSLALKIKRPMIGRQSNPISKKNRLG